MKAAAFLFIATAAFLLSGCTTQANIRHTEMKSTGAVKNAGIFVREAKDERPDAALKVIGGVYNGYDIRMGDIKQPDDLLENLRLVLTNRLRAIGYRIQTDETDLVLDLTLRMLTCNSRTTSKCAMGLLVKLIDHGEVVFEDSYDMDESKFALIVDTSCTGALNALIDKMFEKITKDIDLYLAS